MTLDQELLDQAYIKGQEAGRLEVRVQGVERGQEELLKGQREMSKAITSAVKLAESTAVTVQLLAASIKSQAESDKKMWEQRDKAAAETALAIEKEKNNAAKAIREEKELTATTLANEVNKANIKWVPKLGWATIAYTTVALIGIIAAIYFGLHGQAVTPGA